MKSSIQIVGLYPQLTGFGGIQQASRQMACALQNILARRDASLSLLGLNDPTGAQTLALGSNTIPFAGFDRAKIRFVANALLQAARKPRIIIAGHPNLAQPAAWMKKFSPFSKIIVLCHGIDVWDRLPHRRRKALLAADIALVPSTYTAQKLASIQEFPGQKIRTLPWPINNETLKRAENRAALNAPPDFPSGRVILAVGRWASTEKYKGADDLIRALPQLINLFPDLHLALVGRGDDIPRLKSIASNLKISPSVHFLEGLTDEQLAACYARAEIFALPSTGEGFGIVFLEAMAFGLPVVGAAAGGVTDIIENDVNGLLVPPKNEQALTQALNRLLNDPSLRARLGQNAQRAIKQKYLFASLEKGLEQILLECGLDSPPPK
ncbi:MAG TPA: glycosyltransferase family 4 protein [Candidatus Acidoferrales bacterium]